MERPQKQGSTVGAGILLILFSLIGGCAHHKWGRSNSHSPTCEPQTQAPSMYSENPDSSVGGSGKTGGAYQGAPIQPSRVLPQPGSERPLGSGSY